ncbi:MAG: hypothetical protein J0L93_10180 [Deltaproteobacteria bacterium]|nr:hypothetical protein [Deltaproteobacteria bacterium]
MALKTRYYIFSVVIFLSFVANLSAQSILNQREENAQTAAEIILNSELPAVILPAFSTYLADVSAKDIDKKVLKKGIREFGKENSIQPIYLSRKEYDGIRGFIDRRSLRNSEIAEVNIELLRESVKSNLPTQFKQILSTIENRESSAYTFEILSLSRQMKNRSGSQEFSNALSRSVILYLDKNTVEFEQIWQLNPSLQNVFFDLWPTDLESDRGEAGLTNSLLIFRNYLKFAAERSQKNPDQQTTEKIVSKIQIHFQSILENDFQTPESQYELNETLKSFDWFRQQAKNDLDRYPEILADSEKIKKLAEGFPNPHEGRVHLVVNPQDLKSFCIKNFSDSDSSGYCVGLDYMNTAMLAHVQFVPAEKRDDFKTIEQKLSRAFQTNESQKPAETISIYGYASRKEFLDAMKSLSSTNDKNYGPYEEAIKKIQKKWGLTQELYPNNQTLGGRDGDFNGIYFTPPALKRHALYIKKMLDESLPIHTTIKSTNETSAFNFHRISIIGYRLPQDSEVPDLFYVMDSNLPGIYSELAFNPFSDRKNWGQITYNRMYDEPVAFMKTMTYQNRDGLNELGYTGKFKFIDYSFQNQGSGPSHCEDSNESQNVKNLDLSSIFDSAPR